MNVNGIDIKVVGKLLRIARLGAEGYFFLDEDPKQLIEEIGKAEPSVDLFTFTQRVPDSTPRFSYPMEMDNCAAIAVTTYDQWWTQQIRPEARNRARQAEKRGAVLRVVPFDEELAKGIWGIYNESPVRGGRKFPHYGKDLETVYREAATFLDHSVFIGAYVEDTLIGFVKLTKDETGTQANLMNILSMMSHREKAPTNALISHAVRACADRGISYLVYQRYSYGKKLPDGIMKFKEVNGFKQYDLPRYYVPLTPMGRMALQLGLHQRLVDKLPAGMAQKLRDWRYSWYQRKVQVAK
jgi:hypothetical protein